MRELMFDELWSDLQDFVEKRSGHRPETMPGHFRFVIPHTPQGRIDGVV